jgi:type I restriction enzyme R subunit
VAAFTSFNFEGKKVTQDDEAVNGYYAGRVVQEFKKKNNLVKLIIVADKLRTGFDEPKLAIMYIDRKLMGTNAVQTLGRLNRVAPVRQNCFPQSITC